MSMSGTTPESRIRPMMKDNLQWHQPLTRGLLMTRQTEMFLNAMLHDCSVENLERSLHSSRHTHTRLMALFQDYPGEPVPER